MKRYRFDCLPVDCDGPFWFKFTVHSYGFESKPFPTLKAVLRFAANWLNVNGSESVDDAKFSAIWHGEPGRRKIVPGYASRGLNQDYSDRSFLSDRNKAVKS